MCVVVVVGDSGPSDYSLLDVARNESTPIVFGQSGPAVVALQNALAAVAFSVSIGGKPPDGIFGPATLAGLENFRLFYNDVQSQQKEGKQVGPLTMALFDKALAITACATPGLLRLPQSKVTFFLAQQAVRLLHLYWQYPVGTEVPFQGDNDGEVFFARIEMHFHPWNGTESPHGYHHGVSLYYPDPRLLQASPLAASRVLPPEDDVKKNTPLTIEQREALLNVVLSTGSMRSPQWTTLTFGAVTLQVASDYAMLGTPNDFLRIPLAAFTAQKLCSLWGWALPTTMLVDAIWSASDDRLTPAPLPPGPQMRSNAYFWKENQLIEAQLSQNASSRVDLIAGHKKDVVNTVQYDDNDHEDNVAIYGWQYPNGTIIQPLFLGHAASWADYSHGIRFISQNVTYTNQSITLSSCLQDVSCSKYISREGPLKSDEIPVAKQFAPPCFTINF